MLGRVVATLLSSVALSAATPAELTGIWEQIHFAEDGITASQMNLEANGVVRLVSASQLTGLGSQDGVVVFPGGITLSFEGEGTWREASGHLSMVLTTTRLLIDGESFDTGIVRVSQALARALADALEVPEAEFDAFAQLILQGLQIELNEDALLTQVLGDLEAGIPYRLDGPILWFTDADGEPSPWSRVPSTAVSSRSWAGVKAGVGQAH